jgi:hypothetical protein
VGLKGRLLVLGLRAFVCALVLALVFVAFAAMGATRTTPVIGTVSAVLRIPLDASPERVVQRQRFVVQHSRTGSRPRLTQIAFGFSSPGGPHDLARVAGIERTVGKHAAILDLGQAFDEPLDEAGIANARRHGSLPMLTWYLWSTNYGRHGGSKRPEPRFALRTVIDGRHDAYIRAFARAVAADGHPLVLRFAPEMNGFWYPWSTAPTGNIRGQHKNSNRRGEFVQAWRHVHRIFDQERATNVIWDWSPNAIFYGQKYPLSEFYPGDRYVDLVGVDGYNWGSVKRWSKWFTPAQIFDSTLSTLRSMTDRPFLINEVGSSELGGDKAVWVREFLAYLERNRDIAGFLWFDWHKETDWRFGSSAASRTAFIEGLRGARFTGSPQFLLRRLGRRLPEVGGRPNPAS